MLRGKNVSLKAFTFDFTYFNVRIFAKDVQLETKRPPVGGRWKVDYPSRFWLKHNWDQRYDWSASSGQKAANNSLIGKQSKSYIPTRLPPPLNPLVEEP